MHLNHAKHSIIGCKTIKEEIFDQNTGQPSYSI